MICLQAVSDGEGHVPQRSNAESDSALQSRLAMYKGQLRSKECRIRELRAALIASGGHGNQQLPYVFVAFHSFWVLRMLTVSRQGNCGHRLL